MDKGVNVLEQYGVEVKNSSRMKGALLLDTNLGYCLLREFRGSEKHLKLEYEIQKYLRQKDEILVDGIIPNANGQLFCVDRDGQKYYLRQWYIGKDCEIWNQDMLCEAVRTLAVFHQSVAGFARHTEEPTEEKQSLEGESQGILTEFERHNQELKRCRSYIRKRKRKNEFECLVLESFEKFYQRGLALTEGCRETGIFRLEQEASDAGDMMHGAFNYHNIFFVGKRGFLTNFEHCKCGLQIRDLYHFLRKVLEKYNWDDTLGKKMLESYQQIRPLSSKEQDYIKTCLSYPEKYWKIVSHYYNSGKSWIPDKDIEKLKVVIRQDAERERFLSALAF